ncbi:zinc ribbon domain-containing protein [Cuniculiplasma sp. SKW4]|uniref:zinc ribbon domain-containing protein n=1 Tax=Cuniculiplasma sp. SKW4 TaxID=3400171 RepID=UPI003FD43D8B
MFCIKCGTQLPDDAKFCSKCGTPVSGQSNSQTGTQDKNDRQTIASASVTELKCPGCGAPIKPVEGETVVTCEYCGTSVSLNINGWQNISKHTMLLLKLEDTSSLRETIKKHMDHGLFGKHIFEESKEEDLSLTYVPYWIVPVSSTTTYKYLSIASEVGNLALDAAVMGAMDEGMNRGGMGGGMIDGMMIGGMMGGGMMGSNNSVRGGTLANNYNFPVVAIKGNDKLQPKNYKMPLDQRVPYDKNKIMPSIKVLNGDVDEETAKELSKTYVAREQEEMVRQKYHHIESLNTQSSASTPELIHVPVWVGKYSHKKNEYFIAIDASTGSVLNSDIEKIK